jgi:YD repeat-containing protein
MPTRRRATWQTRRDTPSLALEPASYDYDAESRVVSDTEGPSATLDYSEDASGNLTTLPDGAAATYDDASELTSSTLSSAATDYTCSADGERTGETQGSSALAIATHNGAEQLTSYDDAGADLSSATYDGSGRRSSDTVGSNSQHFVWDETSSVPDLLMDGTNAYIYAEGTAPIEQINLATRGRELSGLRLAGINEGRCQLDGIRCRLNVLRRLGQSADRRWAHGRHAVRLRRRLHRSDGSHLPDQPLLRPDDRAVPLGRPAR